MKMNIGYMIFPSPLIFSRDDLYEYKFTADYLDGYIEILPKVFEYETFAKEIIKSRNNLGIPLNGLKLKDYQKIIGLTKAGWYPIFDRLEKPFGNTKYKIGLQRSAEEELKRLERIFKFSRMVERQLPHVLLGNTFIPIGMRIAFGMQHHPKTNTPYYLDLTIPYNVSKKELHNFIDREWDLIKAELSNLPGGKTSNKPLKRIPDELEIRVIELVDQGFRHSDISDKINNEFQQYKSENLISQINIRSRKVLEKSIKKL